MFIASKYKGDQAAEIVADTPDVELRLMLDGTVPGYESYEAAVAEREFRQITGYAASANMALRLPALEVIAWALVAAAEEVLTADPTAREVAAAGFRDTSRLAASDVTMMVDILLTNREMVLHALRACRNHLDRLAEWLEQGDEGALRIALTSVRRQRLEMF